MPILFDSLMPDTASIPESIGVSTSGKYVISSNDQGTFLETVSNTAFEPIMLIPEPCDTIGFFGYNIDAVALASGSTLRILQLSRMEIVAKVTIRPGSLFVPKSGESPYIGVVSATGQTYLIDEDGNATKSSLKVSEDHEVLWSSHAVPSGYSWVTSDSANLYIRSRPEDEGSVFTSPYGMTLYSTHRDNDTQDSIASLTTVDAPHILMSVRSTDDTVNTSPLVKFSPGAVIDQVVQLPNGKPLVVSGYHGAQVYSAPVGNETKLSDLVESVIADQSTYTWIQCMGMASYLSWEQTPVTPPEASITNYATSGRPRYDIISSRNRSLTQSPVSNKVLEAVGPDGNVSTYRLTSPFKMNSQLADYAAVICDYDGSIAAGKYSPSVEVLYQMDIPVVIVPVNKNKSSHRVVIEDLAADLDDIAEDIVKRKIARDLYLIADGDISLSGVKAFSLRRSRYKGLMLIDPDEESVGKIPSRKSGAVTVLSTGDDLPRVPSQTYAQVVRTADDITEAYSRLFNY